MSATQLGAISIREALNRANISGDMVDEVYMGNVLQANVGSYKTTKKKRKDHKRANKQSFFFS